MKLSTRTKTGLVIVFLLLSVMGFMVKLPSAFRHYDKVLHALFYFLAAGLLNILFTKRKLLLHLLVFVVLFLFGTAIEYAQEYSNKLLHKKIHGRFDPEDIQWNLKGLIAFSLLWLLYIGVTAITGKVALKAAPGKQ